MTATSATSPPADVEPSRGRRRRRWPARAVVVGLVLSGVVVTSWPVTLTVVHNHQSAGTANATDKDAVRAPRPEVARVLAEARRYNATLTPATLRDPWARRGPAGSADHAAYLRELALFPAMGTLTIPRIRVHLPVYHDTTTTSMAHGVGHFFGSSLPVGGPGTHAVLATHSGMSYATLFDRLPELRVGDRFWLRVYGEVLTYRVDHITKVLPDQLDQVRRVPGQDYVTLLTCVPRRVNTYRLLVRGVRVPDRPSAATLSSTKGTDLVIQRWMIPRLAFSLTALGILALIVAGWVRGDRRRRPEGRGRGREPGSADGATAPRGP
jgi:LPXTG-site transpeptidase (sortase) family protein